MKTYQTNQVKNIALLGNSGSGKTVISRRLARRYGGELVDQGTHEELLEQRGFYHNLYMSQFKGKAPAGSESADVDFVST